ncbi:MAG TPA: hypothetical protein VN957_10015 [Chthoniobacterales bacterium]|jgi:hypothetical protein|nr:hypothetical protein [Chthoniobacterales bacterium]
MKAVELGRARNRMHPQPGPDNLFGWTVFILLLCGFAVACWIGTFYVFNHPEQPFNYQLLTKLNKLEPPKRFELTAAPAGEFLGADKLLEKYGAMTAPQLKEESNGLLRSYLRNYDHQIGKVPYVIGKFTVLDAFVTVENQYFGTGMMVLAQSNEVPTIYIEQIFPAEKQDLPAMQRILVTGLGLELRRSYDLSSVAHITNLGDGKLLFTCVPLLYGSYGQIGSSFQLEPPRVLYVKAGLPMVNENQFRNAEQRYAEYRKATGTQIAGTSQKATGNLIASAQSRTPNQNLVSAPKALPVIKATPRGTPGVFAKQGATATPPKATYSPGPVATPASTPSPPTVAATQPFLASSPTPGANSRAATWQTYRPGQFPRGRLIEPGQGLALADQGIGSDPIYLRGDFTVTAARENRAVLRPKQTGNENVRIIVEFPKGLPVPQEGDSVGRAADRPFQVVDVRRGADGQVNIYVREITAP